MIEKFETLLAGHIGLEAESIGRRSIELAVRERMSARAMTDQAAYYATLGVERGELAALLEEIVVPETWFFRDAEPFRFVGRLARQHAVAHPGRPFRVLSVPCSTGEEPYSIAMTLLDAGLHPDQIHVDAVDLSPRLLARARAGRYGASSFRGDLGNLRERRFTRVNEGVWELAAEVRALVQFHQGNLVQPVFLHREPPYQVVFCRNLLIYLTREGRAAAIEALHARLAAGGVIVLGHAEALDRLDARFRPAAESNAFVYERAGADKKGRPTQPLGAPLPVRPPPRRATPVALPVVPAATPAPAPAPTPAPAASSLARATELAGRGRLAEAASACDEHLRASGPDAAGYYLLGTIRQASGDGSAACVCFERALYLDPAHYEALVHLALLLEQRGDGTTAAQLRRRAERVRPGAGK